MAKKRALDVRDISDVFYGGSLSVEQRVRLHRMYKTLRLYRDDYESLDTVPVYFMLECCIAGLERHYPWLMSADSVSVEDFLAKCREP